MNNKIKHARSQVWVLAGVFVLGLLARTVAAIGLAGALEADPDGYRQLAQNVATQGVYTTTGDPTAFRPPLYPLLLVSTVVGGEVLSSGDGLAFVCVRRAMRFEARSVSHGSSRHDRSDLAQSISSSNDRNAGDFVSNCRADRAREAHRQRLGCLGSARGCRAGARRIMSPDVSTLARIRGAPTNPPTAVCFSEIQTWRRVLCRRSRCHLAVADSKLAGTWQT